MDQHALFTHAINSPSPLSYKGSSSWSQAFLAGIPHLLYPLAMYGGRLTSLQPFYIGGGYPVIVSSLFFWLLLAVGLVFGARSSWPRWTASWIGYGLVGAIELLVVLPTTGTEISEHLAIFAGVSWLLLAIFILVWVTRRDVLDGVLAVVPLMPMWYTLLALDGVKGNEAPLFYLDGLIMGLTVTWVVRKGELLSGLAWILAGVTAVGLPLAYATVYFSNFSPPSGPVPEPQPTGMIRAFLTILIGLFALATPVWVTALVRWRRAVGR